MTESFSKDIDPHVVQKEFEKLSEKHSKKTPIFFDAGAIQKNLETSECITLPLFTHYFDAFMAIFYGLNCVLNWFEIYPAYKQTGHDLFSAIESIQKKFKGLSNDYEEVISLSFKLLKYLSIAKYSYTESASISS